MPLTRRDAAFRDYVMPCGEVDRGKRVFSSRGCAEISTDGRRSALADAPQSVRRAKQVIKEFQFYVCGNRRSLPVSRNSERRGIASQL